MCLIHASAHRRMIRDTVQAFCDAQEPFTGLSISQHIRETMADDTFPYRHSAVSSFVRELFNTGEMPGWASTQVVPGKGPVLYFKVTEDMRAAEVADKIRASLTEGSSQNDE